MQIFTFKKKKRILATKKKFVTKRRRHQKEETERIGTKWKNINDATTSA